MLPTPYMVGVSRIARSGEDAHGNPVKSWADPVVWPVSAIAPGDMDEQVAGQDRSDIRVTLFAPAGHPNEPHEHDRVVIDGLEYDVDGAVKDWTRGPWSNPFAGVQVVCVRVEG